MQTKKRAKSVKFEEKEENEKKAATSQESNEKQEVKDEAPVGNEEKDTLDEPQDDGEDGGKGLEAHFSSTVETLDITEKAEKESEQEKEDTSDNAKAEESVDAVEESKESPLEKDDAFFNVPPDAYDKKKSTMPYFFIVAFITFLIGLTFFAGIYYAISNKGSFSIPGTKKEAEVTKAPQVTPTPTPVDLTAYTVQILNGTSTSGIAAKLKTDLTDAGFKVGTVGNASKDDFEKTEIAAKSKVDKVFLEKLKEIVKKTYVLGSNSTLSSGEADVVVTIGSASAN